MWFSGKRIILASKSPRRAQLLREAGLEYIVKSMDVDEDFPADMPVDLVAPHLAQRKARAAQAFLETKNDVILAADSTVILDQTIFNKPVDYDDAVRMLRQLSGRRHRVVTGCCLLSLHKETVFSGVSQVEFAPLTEEEIRYYIDHYQPFDKAGAYGIQEWIGLCKITGIEGSYANIVGLPVELVYKELRGF